MLRRVGVAIVMTIKMNTLHGLSHRSSSPDRPPVSRELPPSQIKDDGQYRSLLLFLMIILLFIIPHCDDHQPMQ